VFVATQYFIPENTGKLSFFDEGQSRVDIPEPDDTATEANPKSVAPLTCRNVGHKQHAKFIRLHNQMGVVGHLAEHMDV
jgi:hypothetical protein